MDRQLKKVTLFVLLCILMSITACAPKPQQFAESEYQAVVDEINAKYAQHFEVEITEFSGDQMSPEELREMLETISIEQEKQYVGYWGSELAEAFRNK